jgi:hypothetical protein
MHVELSWANEKLKGSKRVYYASSARHMMGVRFGRIASALFALGRVMDLER